jgi:hypothetical protein
MCPSAKLTTALLFTFLIALVPVTEVHATPGQPRPISPPDGSICVTAPLTLDWSTVTGEGVYQFQIGTSCGEGYGYRTLQSDYYMASLEPNTTYYWRVRFGSGKYWSSWSQCWSFSTPPGIQPGVPSPVYPPDGAVDMPTEITFEWEPVPEAATYEIVVGYACGSGIFRTTSESSITISGIEPGNRSYWRVRGVGPCGIKGSWTQCRLIRTAGVTTNTNGKWALHYVEHQDGRGDHALTEGMDCASIAVDAPPGPGRYDVYILGVDVDAVGGTRYGLTCDGPVVFYGWTDASDFWIPTPGWPGPGEANSQTWETEQQGPIVTIGVLDVYVYGSTNSISATVDPRIDYAEWCDATQPIPKCLKKSLPELFGTIGFGTPGTNPCSITPVGLDGFSIRGEGDGILLEWTSTEYADFSYFSVHRSAVMADGNYVRLNDDPIEGAGIGHQKYSYLDTDVIPGTLYFYKLEGMKPAGSSTYFGPYRAEACPTRPDYKLYQNVPNPFSRGDATEIHYTVAAPCVATLKIMDAAGRLVRSMNVTAQAGDNWVSWDGTDDNGRQLASGVYFYQVHAGGLRAERKMLLVE